MPYLTSWSFCLVCKLLLYLQYSYHPIHQIIISSMIVLTVILVEVSEVQTIYLMDGLKIINYSVFSDVYEKYMRLNGREIHSCIWISSWHSKKKLLFHKTTLFINEYTHIGLFVPQQSVNVEILWNRNLAIITASMFQIFNIKPFNCNPWYYYVMGTHFKNQFNSFLNLLFVN